MTRGRIIITHKIRAGDRKCAAACGTSAAAFTLIEMLASMVLMMVLSLTVLTVLGAIARSESIQARSASTDAWPRSIVDAIQWDLSNARSLTVADNSMTIGGYGALAPDGGAATHQPVLVTYSIRNLGGRPCLIRFQRPAAKQLAGSAWTDLVYAGVAKMSVAKLEIPLRHAAITAPAGVPTGKAPVNAAFLVPARIGLTLWSADDRIAPLSRILVVRD
jgi:hypothetical protein